MKIKQIKGNAIIVESDEKHDADYYYKNRIPSKFDKWLDYDFGGIRTYAIPFEDDKDKWYWYEEAWNFVGRQPDKKYYFRCSSSSDRDMIGKVLKFDRFNDVAKYVCLPGRTYESVCEDSYDWGTISNEDGKYIDTSRFQNPRISNLYKEIKNGNHPDMVAEIVDMTAKEYLEACSKIFNTSYEAQVKQVSADKEANDDLIDVIKNKKKAFPLPYLDYTTSSNEGRGDQEGRHRMYTLSKIVGEDAKFPVLVIKYKDENKSKENYNKIKRDSEIDTIYNILSDYEYAKNRWHWDYSDLMQELDDIGYKISKSLPDTYTYKFIDSDIRNGYVITTYTYGPYRIEFYIDTNDFDATYIERVEVK